MRLANPNPPPQRFRSTVIPELLTYPPPPKDARGRGDSAKLPWHRRRGILPYFGIEKPALSRISSHCFFSCRASSGSM
jgi:hypothetical protein